MAFTDNVFNNALKNSTRTHFTTPIYPYPTDLIIMRNGVVPELIIEQLRGIADTQESPDKATTVKRFEDGRKEPELNPNVRNTDWYNIPEELHRNLEQAVSSTYFQWMQPKYNCEFKSYEPVQFLGYPRGGHYLVHIDGESTERERIMERDISVIYYLNEEFGGGELEFPELGLTIKPKKGMMIAFPSYREFAHTVHPVTWGHRYSLVSWIATQQSLYETIPSKGV